MIYVTLKDGVYLVKCITHSFHKDYISIRYYDLRRGLISEESDFPDNALTRPLQTSQIEWFNKYFLHKAIEV